MAIGTFLKSFLITIIVIAIFVAAYAVISRKDESTLEVSKSVSDKSSNVVLNPAQVRRMIEQVIPAGHDAVSAQYFEDDLNGDGTLEYIVCSFPKLTGSSTRVTSSPPLVLILNRDSASGSVSVLASTTLTSSALTHAACSKSGNTFVDIDHDKIKELVLDLGIGNSSIDFYGIFRFDVAGKKISLVKLKAQTGKIGDAIIPVGASMEHALAYNFEDIDGDGKLELIKRTGTLKQEATPEGLSDPSNWNWQIEAFSGNSTLLAFDAALSQQYVQGE